MLKALRWEDWVGTMGLRTALLALWAITPLDEKIGSWWQRRAARH